jgi:hypothetical protein
MPTKTFDFLPAQADGMSAKASGNQAMVRKIRAPGFIFVADRAISAFRPWVANLNRNLNKVV